MDVYNDKEVICMVNRTLKESLVKWWIERQGTGQVCRGIQDLEKIGIFFQE